MARLTILCQGVSETTPKQETSLHIYADGVKILERRISPTSFLDILTTAFCVAYSEKMDGIKSTTDQEDSI